MTDESIYIGPRPDERTVDPALDQVRPEPPPVARDFRLEALAFLFEELKRRSPERAEFADRALGQHPDAAAIRGVRLDDVSFTDLIFDEIAGAESAHLGVQVDRNLQTREPFAYWLRRRELAHHAEVVAVWGSLPPLFVALARMSGNVLQQRLTELGARMIAGIFLARPELDVREMLRPLNSQTTRRVFELMSDAKDRGSNAAAVPPEASKVADEWIGAWERISADPARGPKRVGDLLGRMLIATLFRCLDEALRRRALELAVTVIVKKLEESEVMPLETGTPEWTFAEQLAEGVFLGDSS